MMCMIVPISNNPFIVTLISNRYYLLFGASLAPPITYFLLKGYESEMEGIYLELVYHYATEQIDHGSWGGCVLNISTDDFPGIIAKLASTSTVRFRLTHLSLFHYSNTPPPHHSIFLSLSPTVIVYHRAIDSPY